MEFSVDWVLAFVTLSAMEVVLGLDNIIFIAILVAKLPLESRDKIRSVGIGLALFSRLALLFSLSWLMRLTDPLFSILDKPFSGRDLILLVGGLFLMVKATREIHEKIENHASHDHEPKDLHKKKKAGMILFQIILLDIIFSLDSVITAVGMAQQISVMIAAMITSVVVMLVFSKSISNFVDDHPSIKILALAFLILIGVTLVVESMGQHVSKGYIYFAMAFSLAVQVLNIRFDKKSGRAKVAK